MKGFSEAAEQKKGPILWMLLCIFTDVVSVLEIGSERCQNRLKTGSAVLVISPYTG